MTGIRRALVLVTLTLTVLLGTQAAAQAAFSDRVTTPAVTVTTLTVAPATDVTARLDSCNNARWMDVTVSWAHSATTRGLNGYRVQAHRDGQITTVASVGATTSAVSITVDKFTATSPTVSFSVTTLTAYGWTAESEKSGAITC